MPLTRPLVPDTLEGGPKGNYRRKRDAVQLIGCVEVQRPDRNDLRLYSVPLIQLIMEVTTTRRLR